MACAPGAPDSSTRWFSDRWPALRSRQLTLGSRAVLPLALFLVVCMVVANLSVPAWGTFSHSGVFMCSIVATALLGPGPGVAIVAVAEVGAFVFDRIRVYAALVNAVASTVPTLCFGLVVGAPIAGGELTATTCAVMLGAGVRAAIFSWAASTCLVSWYDGRPLNEGAASGVATVDQRHVHDPARDRHRRDHPRGRDICEWTSCDPHCSGTTSRCGWSCSACSCRPRRPPRREPAPAGGSGARAEDRERRRLAERLHDEAIQSLLVAQHDLGDDDPEVREKAGDAVGRRSRTCGARSSICILRFSIRPGWRLRSRRWQEAGPERCVRAGGRRPAGVEGLNDEFIFALAREFLVNAAKHARPAKVRVLVKRMAPTSCSRFRTTVSASRSRRRTRRCGGATSGLPSARERVRRCSAGLSSWRRPGGRAQRCAPRYHARCFGRRTRRAFPIGITRS